MNGLESTDLDIRIALHAKRFRNLKTCPETLIIDELGLAHARSRIDVAVINGCIHGYEIKSSKDTLDRFPAQIDIYRRTLQRVTFVAATKHVSKIMSCAPCWCGVVAAARGPRGGISFQEVRSAVANPDVEPVMLAHLLWRDEVVELLSAVGHTPKELRRPRRRLYEMLCEAMTIHEIASSIRTFMMRRQAWRDRRARA